MRSRKPKEISIENPVVAWWNKLADKHGWIRTRKMNGLGNRSWPDRLFPIPGGKPFFIEFKRPGEKPTELQAHMHQQMKETGYDIEVHDNKDEALDALQKRLIAAGYPVRRRRCHSADA